jgi:hypothetical protein
VPREIVEHDEVTGLERRRPELRRVGAQRPTGDWAVAHQRRDDAALLEPDA